MIQNDFPLWFQQINYQKTTRIISNGLTIPYLIGAYQVCNKALNQSNPVQNLIIEITESQLDKCAVLQMCPNIRQYVIGIDYRDFCEHFLKNEIVFKNSNEQSSLYITQSACQLGNILENVIREFESLYTDYLTKNMFSWNNNNLAWERFSDNEIDLIRSAM